MIFTQVKAFILRNWIFFFIFNAKFVFSLAGIIMLQLHSCLSFGEISRMYADVFVNILATDPRSFFAGFSVTLSITE